MKKFITNHKLPQTDKASNQQAPQPELLPQHINLNLQALKPDGIMQLQRTIGNKAIQRLLNNGQISMLKQPRIQRQTGLRQSTNVSAYSNSAYTFASNPKKQSKPVMDIMNHLADKALTTLKDVGVTAPPKFYLSPTSETSGSSSKSDDSGSFSPGSWTISLNKEIAFEGATTIGEIGKDTSKEDANKTAAERNAEDEKKDELVAGIADTIYHESRHCEQYFRMAQQHAAEIMAEESTLEDSAVAEKVMKRMGMDITEGAALAAVKAQKKNPLTTSQTGEAKNWDESAYGIYRVYSNVVMELEDYTKLILEEAQPAIAHIQLSDASTLKGKQMQTLTGDIKQSYINRFANSIQKIIQLRDDTIVPYLRFFTSENKGTTKSIYDGIVEKHLNELKNIITEMEGYLPVTDDAGNLGILESYVQDIEDERYQAYRELPDEVDAFAADAQVQTEYSAMTAKNNPPPRPTWNTPSVNKGTP